MSANRFLGLIVTFFLIVSLMLFYSLMILQYDYMEFPPRVLMEALGQQAEFFSDVPILHQNVDETRALLTGWVDFFSRDPVGWQICFLLFSANLLLIFYMIHYLYAIGRVKRLSDLTGGGDEVALSEHALKDHIVRTVNTAKGVYAARVSVKIYRRGIFVQNRLKIYDGESVPEVLEEIRHSLTKELREQLGVTARITVTNRVLSLVTVKKKETQPAPLPAPVQPAPDYVVGDHTKED